MIETMVMMNTNNTSSLPSGNIKTGEDESSSILNIVIPNSINPKKEEEEEESRQQNDSFSIPISTTTTPMNVTVVLTPEEKAANEANILFKHLPSVYSDEDDEEEDEDESDDAEDDLKSKPPVTKPQPAPPAQAPTQKSLNISKKTNQDKMIIASKKARLHYPDYSDSSSSADFIINQVLPRLFISDDMSARNKTVLNKYKITHILNLTTNIPNKFEPDIKYLKFVIFDFETQNISQYFSESFEFIESALKENDTNRVLVHCNAGISRSASFVIAYMLQKRLYKCYKDAYNHLKKARPVIEPNRGFEKQLINFEKRMRKNNRGCSIM